MKHTHRRITLRWSLDLIGRLLGASKCKRKETVYRTQRNEKTNPVGVVRTCPKCRQKYFDYKYLPIKEEKEENEQTKTRG